MTLRRALEALKLPRGLHAERVQWLYDGLRKAGTVKEAAVGKPKQPQYVLYWMQTSVRSQFNYSLEYAIAAAQSLSLPLRVVYFFGDRSVVPEDHVDPNAVAFATERHALFALQGLADVHHALHERGLCFHVYKQMPDATRSAMLMQCARHAALVVTDRPYLRDWKKALEDCVEQCQADSTDWALAQIEGDLVVPVASASPKEEYAARTIRPKITRALPQFLVPLEQQDVPAVCQTKKINGEPDSSLTALDLTKPLDQVLAKLDLDREVHAVGTLFEGGESQGMKMTQTFLNDKLSVYATDRNEPSKNATSLLSLYLHFGHVSAAWVALQVRKLTPTSKDKAAKDSFLEELIVRRELSINLIVYNDEYDSMGCLPEYAFTTLQIHAKDKREHVYSTEDLEAARTNDRYWNAAQMELVATGNMHGYMRMYWGKKILEWTKTPQSGFTTALYLNNKYALDAPDPNSYTGIAWTFGKHDQGWKERSIFGKVRYMNESGLRRKFNMEAYVTKVHKLIKELGLHSALPLQSTMDQFVKATPAEESKTKRKTPRASTSKEKKETASPVKKKQKQMKLK